MTAEQQEKLGALLGKNLAEPGVLGDLQPSAPEQSFRGDGIVSKILVRDGDFVAPRAALEEMFDPGSLVIRFAVPEVQATELRRDLPVVAQLDAYPG